MLRPMKKSLIYVRLSKGSILKKINASFTVHFVLVNAAPVIILFHTPNILKCTVGRAYSSVLKKKCSLTKVSSFTNSIFYIGFYRICQLLIKNKKKKKKTSRTGTSLSVGLMLYPQHSSFGRGVFPLSRNVVGVFYSPDRLGKEEREKQGRSERERVRNEEEKKKNRKKKKAEVGTNEREEPLKVKKNKTKTMLTLRTKRKKNFGC